MPFLFTSLQYKLSKLQYNIKCYCIFGLVWRLTDVRAGTQGCGHSPCSEGEVLGHSEEFWFSSQTNHSRLHPSRMAVQRAVMVNLRWEKVSKFTLKYDNCYGQSALAFSLCKYEYKAEMH